MATEKYHLNYFDCYARGEPIRWVFAMAGVPYTETRIPNDYDAFLRDVKPTAGPFNAVPYITIGEGENQKVLAQHITICRYLGNKFGLTVENEFDRALLDMYADGANELWITFEPYAYAVFEKCSEEKIKSTWKEFAAFWVHFAERYASFISKSEGKFLIGDKPTWADLYLAEWLDRVDKQTEAPVDNPAVKTYLARVRALPEIAEYLSKRPKSEVNL